MRFACRSPVPSFVLFVGFLASGQNCQPWRGSLFLGTAALVRANFILVPPLVFALALLFPSTRAALLHRARLGRALLAFALAATPVLLWAVRNAELSGRFPFPCSGEGQLIYGGNND